MLIHAAVMATTQRALVSDMRCRAKWWDVNVDPRLHPGELMGPAINDLEFYEKVKAIYDAKNAWTWSRPPITEAKVYLCEY